jgi:archaellum component FlaF (FlaF/FlaG flagellin family)
MVLIDINTTNHGSLTVNRDQITVIHQSGQDVVFWIGARELFVQNISVSDFIAHLQNDCVAI